MFKKFRCLGSDHFIPGRAPLSCYSAKPKENDLKIECCDTDFCNNNILLELPSRGIVN